MGMADRVRAGAASLRQCSPEIWAILAIQVRVGVGEHRSAGAEGGGGLRARDLAGGVDASRAPHASFHSPPDPFPFHPTHEVLESFGYFSLSITAADYLTQEFGVSDLEAREPLPSVAPSAAPPLWSFPCPSARRRRPSAVRIARRGPQRHVPACTPPSLPR